MRTPLLFTFYFSFFKCSYAPALFSLAAVLLEDTMQVALFVFGITVEIHTALITCMQWE